MWQRKLIWKRKRWGMSKSGLELQPPDFSFFNQCLSLCDSSSLHSGSIFTHKQPNSIYLSPLLLFYLHILVGLCWNSNPITSVTLQCFSEFTNMLKVPFLWMSKGTCSAESSEAHVNIKDYTGTLRNVPNWRHMFLRLFWDPDSPTVNCPETLCFTPLILIVVP